MNEHHRLVAGINRHHPERCVYRSVRRARQQLVLPRDVGDSAVTALGWSPEGSGELAGATGCIDDQVGIHRVAGHPDPDGADSFAADVIDVTDPERDAGLRLGG